MKQYLLIIKVFCPTPNYDQISRGIGIHSSGTLFRHRQREAKGGKVIHAKTTRPPSEDLVVFCKPKTIIFVPQRRASVSIESSAGPERGLQKIQIIPEQPTTRLRLESDPAMHKGA